MQRISKNEIKIKRIREGHVGKLDDQRIWEKRKAGIFYTRIVLMRESFAGYTPAHNRDTRGVQLFA